MLVRLFRARLLPIAVLMASMATISANAGTGGGADHPDTRSPVIRQENSMQISIEIEETTITAILEDSEAARDFASLLPLSLTLEDYASTEKISDLPKRLSTSGAPAGITPKVGDLAYYAPWGNLAIFHKDFRYSSGLVKLGTLDSGIELFRRPGSYKATIRKLER
ncbi:cyclophilin-like fold protein [Azotobacter chroococcum]|nr:cyclophilin-like fold protein [Azotobacter chroococcum]